MKKALICLAIVFSATTVMAGSQPIQLSLTPDIAIHDRSETIEGLTLSIWGENRQSSLALGIVNGSTGQSVGLGLGLILNYADRYTGVHLAPINFAKGSFFGLQAGCINYAAHMKGVQLGFINYAETAQTGVQIGLVNILSQNKQWFGNFPDEVAPGMVLLNWRFE